jgi:hypothetical protein
MAAKVAQAAPTLDEIRTWPATVGIEAVARALGISRAVAYEHAGRDALPCRVIKFGSATRAVTASLVAFLAAED